MLGEEFQPRKITANYGGNYAGTAFIMEDSFFTPASVFHCHKAPRINWTFFNADAAWLA